MPGGRAASFVLFGGLQTRAHHRKTSWYSSEPHLSGNKAPLQSTAKIRQQRLLGHRDPSAGARPDVSQGQLTHHDIRASPLPALHTMQSALADCPCWHQVPGSSCLKCSPQPLWQDCSCAHAACNLGPTPQGYLMLRTHMLCRNPSTPNPSLCTPQPTLHIPVQLGLK